MSQHSTKLATAINRYHATIARQREDAEQLAWEETYRTAARKALAEGHDVSDAHVIAEETADKAITHAETIAEWSRGRRMSAARKNRGRR